jgi:hypothetical protein
MLNVIKLSVIMLSVVAPRVEIIMTKPYQLCMSEIANKNERDGTGWNGTEQDLRVTVLVLKIS